VEKDFRALENIGLDVCAPQVTEHPFIPVNPMTALNPSNADFTALTYPSCGPDPFSQPNAGHAEEGQGGMERAALERKRARAVQQLVVSRER